MQSCKIVNGRLTCKEDDLAKYSIQDTPTIQTLLRTQAPPKFKPSSIKTSVKTTHTQRKDITHPIHDKFEEVLQSQNVPEKHKQDVRDIFHPIIGNHITKPNTTEVPQLVREKAILTQASTEYFESNKNQLHVEQYLAKHGLNNKYTIDYELSTNDGLVLLNNESNNATLAFRGTKPSNIKDWAENLNFATTDWQVDPLETIYGKRIKTFYENAVNNYDIEHIVGFSKGGWAAIGLGDHTGIETTTFSPAVTAGHLRTSKSTKHNIWNTTEDVVSILANPLKIKNRNVSVNTLDPITELDSINPMDTHDIQNYITTQSARRASHVNKLTHDFVESGKIQTELEASRISQDMVDLKMNYTDYVRQMEPKEVNILDNTMSKNIERNGLLHKTWKESGGTFTQVESEHLTRATESNYKTVTDRLQRVDYAQMPKHMQTKLRVDMETEHAQIESDLAKQVQENTLNKKYMTANASHLARGGATLGVGMIVGESVGVILGEDNALLESMLPTDLYKGLTDIRDKFKPITDFIAEPIKEEAKPFSTGAAMAAITGGSVALEGAAAIASYEGAKASGFITKNIAKKWGANEEVQRHVDTVTEALTAPSIFVGASQGLAAGVRTVGSLGLAAGLRTAALAELAVPLPGARVVAGLSFAMAVGLEAFDYWSSSSQPQTSEAPQTSEIPQVEN